MSNERKQRHEPIRSVTLKNGKVKYRLIVDVGMDENGKRRQVCSTHDTRKDARLALAKIRTEVEFGSYVAKDGKTVSEYLTEWLNGLHKLKATTIVSHKSVLRPVMGALGHKQLQKLTKADLDQHVKERMTNGYLKGKQVRGVSARTMELTLTVLQAALEAAKKEGLVTRNVAALVSKPKREDNSPIVSQNWTAGQAREFLTHVANDRFVAAWRLSLYGLRRGEVMGLTWDSVDLEGAKITVRSTRVVAGREVITSSTKNRKERILTIGPEVVADLKKLKAQQAKEQLSLGAVYNPANLVVVNEDGTPVRPETYSELFDRHTKTAGLPRIRLHDLRHTTASLLAAAGVPVVDASAMLGHDPVVFQRIYAHALEEGLRKAGGVLAGLYAVGQ